jgi:hypothetical protein
MEKSALGTKLRLAVPRRAQFGQRFMNGMWAAHSVQRLLGGTFDSDLTGKRFVPYWWEGGNFEVNERYHDNLPRFQRECCTVSKEFGDRGKKMKTIKSWFCPTLHFAVGDDNTNRDLGGYSKFNTSQQKAGYRFGSKQMDVGALNYRPEHTGTMATYMYVFAGEHENVNMYGWVEAVNASTHSRN